MPGDRIGRDASHGTIEPADVPFSSPVLLVAARPWPLAAVSRLVKRPHGGLAWTRRTRSRKSHSEEDETRGSSSDQDHPCSN